MSSGEHRYRLDEMVSSADGFADDIGKSVRVNPRTLEPLQGGDSLHLRELVDIVNRHKKEALVVFVVVVIITFMVSMTQREVFRSQALLRYEEPTNAFSTGPYFSSGKGAVLSKFIEIPGISNHRNKAREIAISRLQFYSGVFSQDTVENVRLWRQALAIHETGGEFGLIKQMKLNPQRAAIVGGADMFHKTWLDWLKKYTVEDFEKIVDENGGVFQGVSVERRQADKKMLDVRFEGHDSDLLPCIVNTMVLTMMNFEVESKRDKEDRAARSLENSLNSKRMALKALEEEVRSLARRHGLLGENETILSSVVELERRYKLLQSRSMDVEQDLEASQLALEEKEIDIKKTPREARIPIYDNKTATELQQKRRDLTRLRMDLQERHPEIQELQKEIKLLEEQLRNEAEGAGVPVSVQVVPNPAYEALNTETLRLRSRITMLTGKESSLIKQMKDIENQISKQSPTTELRIKNDKIGRLREQIEVMQKNIALRDFEKATATSHLEVLSAALKPGSPIGPNRTKNIILGTLVGLVMAVATAFVLDYIDTTLHSEVDIARYFKLECIGVIPEARVPEEAYIDADNINTHLVENFEMIKHHLEANFGNLPRSMLVTSTVQNEGKSTISLNLAASIANEGKKVLLVNMDFRKEARHPIEHLFMRPGEIVEGLSGFADSELQLESVVYKTLQNNLFYVPAGLLVNNPSRLFRSARIWELLESLRARVDVLIIDGPAMSSFVDGYLISQKVEHVLFVCADDITPIGMAKKCVDKLKKFDISMAGAILNRSKDRAASEYGYYGNYSSKS